MTISSENRKAGPYDGNDVTTAFPFAFKVFTNADVYVIKTDADGTETPLTLTTDYTVSLNANQNSNPGGTVTLPAALASNYTLTITSSLEYLQPTDLTNQGGFYPGVVTNALDRLTIFCQQLSERIGRAALVPISATAATRASKLLGFDALGNAMLYVAQAGTSLVDLAATSGASLIGFVQLNVGAVSRTVQSKLRESLSFDDIDPAADGVTDDSGKWNTFKGWSGGRKLVRAGTYKINGTVKTYAYDVIEDDIQLFPPGLVGTENRAVERSFRNDRAAIRVGGSDTAPTNDERNYWRGLPSTNSWGNTSNIGLFSTAWNRNGASYGTYSNTFGHDCVAYGIAALAGGAGSCAGDPDNPTSPAFEGYAAFAWGKNVLASGEKSAAFGEESKATTRAAFAAGYAAETGTYSSSGLGAVALGRNVKAFGEGSVALGKFVQSSNGSFTLGSGVNAGTVLNNQRTGAIGFGTNTAYPAFYVNPGTGTGAISDVGYTEVFAHPMRFTDMKGGTTLFTCGQVKPIITNSGGNGYGGVQMEASINGTVTSICRADSDSNIGSFLPTADNARRLGSASLRWEVVFAATGAINTSDRDAKTQIEDIPLEWLRAWGDVKQKRFKMRDAVAEKGDKARWHVGWVAQDIEEAFAAHGLDAFQIGLLCLDKWDAVEVDGEVVREAGQRYGVRYDEAAVLEAAYIRARLDGVL